MKYKIKQDNTKKQQQEAEFKQMFSFYVEVPVV